MAAEARKRSASRHQCDARQKPHLDGQSPGSTARPEGKGEVSRSLGRTKMRHHDDLRIPIEETRSLVRGDQCGSYRSQCRFHRHVQIGAQQRALAAYVDVVKRAKFGHEVLTPLGSRSRSSSVFSQTGPNTPPHRACASRSPIHCRTRRGRGRTACRGSASASHRRRRYADRG